jgi:hypothetical protein
MIIVPSLNGNVMSGQNNYLGTVTSYDMNESEMGYRGSKSSAIALVKEQRVDGSYSFQVELLRCTLMAPVRGYQTEILSNKNNVSENVVLKKIPAKKLNKLDPCLGLAWLGLACFGLFFGLVWFGLFCFVLFCCVVLVYDWIC